MKPRTFKPRSQKERLEIEEAVKMIDEGNYDESNSFIRKMLGTIKLLD